MDEAGESSQALQRLREGARTFHDTEGVLWTVYEAVYPAIDRRAGRCLIFESEYVARRVRDFPPDWRDLPPDELLAVSWRS